MNRFRLFDPITGKAEEVVSASAYEQLLENIDQLVQAVWDHAEGGNIENYRALSDKIEGICRRSARP